MKSGCTDSLFAMQIKRTQVSQSNITHDIIKHIVDIDGVSYIQVHPTFLYESLWNVIVLLIILFYTKKKKYDGQLFLIYLLGYGAGRFWIEGLRTDQLLILGTQVAVSQVLSATVAIAAAVIMIVMFKKKKDAK